MRLDREGLADGVVELGELGHALLNGLLPLGPQPPVGPTSTSPALAQWLAQWPATGGTSFERLQQALQRIPPAVQQLNAAVTKLLGG